MVRIFIYYQKGFYEELGVLYTECPNGHPYLVTEVRLIFYPKHECICCTFQCGRPLQEYTCNTCGSRIGGSNHKLHSSNRDARTYAAQLIV